MTIPAKIQTYLKTGIPILGMLDGDGREVIDSAGFSIDPPFINSLSQQPYESNQGPILPFSDIRSTSSTTIERLQSYLQWRYETQSQNDGAAPWHSPDQYCWNCHDAKC